MSLKNSIWLLILLVGYGCQQNRFSQSEKSVQEIKADGPISNADIIRNPVTADGPIDTVNVAKMTFEETTFDFGQVKEGDIVKHTYKFMNTGKVPLVISDARSTCGCTVPTWPDQPIAPGEGGEIAVQFNTSNKGREQRKPITITANTYPATTIVHLKGFVQSAEATN